MLYLAQVTLNSQTQQRQLHLLACQQSDYWQPLDQDLDCDSLEYWTIGSWVLIEQDEQGQIVSICPALEELLPLLPGSEHQSPLLPQEQAKIEAWRQEMVSRNLELTRQQIELETQRQQLNQQLQQQQSQSP